MTIKQSIFINGAFLILALGLSACSDGAKGTKVVTAWEVQPPYFKLYDNTNDKESKTADVKRMDLDSVLLDLATTDELIFDDANKFPGSLLSATTLCSGANDVIYKQSFRMTLRTANSVYRFLPDEMLLLPTNQLKLFKCSVRFVAQNTNGSIHDFGKDIHFTLFGENQSLLMKLQDETQKAESSEWSETSLISIQRASYHHLPKKNARESYRLKCAEFESTSGSAENLLQLIEGHAASENFKADQLCRLLVQDSNSIVQTSPLFVLRFFDYRNYVQSVENKTSLTGLGKKFDVKVGNITLLNKTKFPVYFSVKKQMMIVNVYAQNNTNQIQLPGRVGFLVWFPTEQTKELSDQTIFVLNPGQGASVAYQVRTSLVGAQTGVGCIHKSPALDILEKKSWDDTNENVLTSIPFMDEPIMMIEGPVNTGSVGT